MITPANGERQWGTLLVAGKRSPGQVRLSGPGLQIGWDIQNATGVQGATTRRTMEPLKEFSADFELSDEEEDGVSDFDLWDEFEAHIKSMVANRQKTFALDVYHPDLARLEITAVTLKGISPMTLDGKGGGRIKVDFIEYRPPKPYKPAPSTKTAGDKKIDAATAEIKALQEEWKAL